MKKEKQEELQNHNEVDVSEQTLERNNHNIKDEFLDEEKEVKNPYNQEQKTSSDDTDGKVFIAEQCLITTLSMFSITVDKSLTKDVAKNYAVLFDKYFPNVEMLDKWKEEIACIISTFALGGAIMIQVTQNKVSAMQVSKPAINDDKLEIRH